LNCDQAKEIIDLTDLMSRLGYEPTAIKKNGKEYWYKSPFRKENDASFHTSYIGGKWIWNDFGDSGGTVIDFVMRHEGYNEQKQALRYLEDMYPGSLFEYQKRRAGRSKQKNFSFQKQIQETNSNSEFENQLQYIEDLPLKSGTLLSYLENARRINTDIAQKYLRLVRYKNLKNGKSYYGLGMKNRAGGFEVRAASDEYSFKSALITRDVSVISGKCKDSVLVFEGMTDFLSLLQMMNILNPPCDAVILHSVNTYKKCSNYIKTQSYQRIYTFLDNDDSGRKCTKRFENDFGRKVVSYSSRFALYKDVNEALKAGVSIDFNFNKSIKNETFELF